MGIFVEFTMLFLILLISFYLSLLLGLGVVILYMAILVRLLFG